MNAEKRKREFKICVRLLIWSAPDARKLRWFREGMKSCHEPFGFLTSLRLSSFAPNPQGHSPHSGDGCG